jgi:hypothetical protein
MLVTLIIVAALLSGAAVLVSLQISSNRSTDLTRSGILAMYCAEAGVAAARPVVASTYGSWPTAFATSSVGDFAEPAWLSSGIGNHDLDGDSVADFSVYLLDNDDEPAANDLTVDADLQVFIVSRCLKYPDTPQEIRELVLYNGATRCYPWQVGGCSSDGNTN